MNKLIKQIALPVAALLIGQASLSAALVLAAWDFNTTDNPNWSPQINDNDGDGFGDGTNSTSFSAIGRTSTIFWNGANGSSAGLDFNLGTQVTNTFGTDSVNRVTNSVPPVPDLDDLVSDTTALAFNGINASFVIGLNTTGLQDIVMTYAGMRGPNAATSISWEYSINGTSFTALGDTDTIGTSYGVQTVDLGIVDSIENQPNVFLRGTMAGATVTQFDSLLAIDNIQVSAVPEPAFYASLAGLLTIALTIYLRRRTAR
ncbi:MAG: hypothetical protein SFY80_02085 [Verrucomicrobiota bacterium]|nr:hypothetical protein [Verrucomicrobiota bacterium]